MSKLGASQAAKTLKKNGMKLEKGGSWWYFFRHVPIYPDGDSCQYECGNRVILLSAM